jgi:Lrp/AsnC family leucine-responsive transcriptional regulator
MKLYYIQYRIHLKFCKNVLAKMIAVDEDIIECHRVTWHIDYFINAAVDGMESMRLLIDQLMPYRVVNTSVSIKSSVPYRHVSPKIKNLE